jgi:chromosome partitioning protein
MANYIADKEIIPKKSILSHSEGVDLIPSNLDLSAIEVSLVNTMSREFTLRNCISPLKDNYDYILIDCMPSLGVITINVLACADKIIVPVQGEYLAANGMTHLIKTVDKVRRQINPKLKVAGILLTLVDKRTSLATDVKEQLDQNYGKYLNIYKTEIPKAIASSKSTSTGKSIFEFDKNSTVAKAYEELAKEVLENEREKTRDEISFIR